MAKIFKKLEAWNVLTVSDIENFAQSGGIIGFINIEDKVRFEINVNAAERADLEISAKLLNLAKIVHYKQ